MTRISSARQHRARHPWLVALLLVTTLLSVFAPASALAQDGEGDQGTVEPGEDRTQQPDDETLTPEGTGSVRVHVFECPVEFRGVTGGDYFDACSGTGMADVSVRLTTLTIEEVRSQTNGEGFGGAIPTDFDESQTTQPGSDTEAGVVEFTGVPAGDYTIVVDLPGATYNFYSYCSDTDTGQESPVTPNDENNGGIQLGDGQNVLCDWFIIPDPNGTLQAENEAGVTPEPTDETEAEATAAPDDETEGAVEGEGQVEPGDAQPTATGEDEAVGGESDTSTETGRVQTPDDSDVGGQADGASITIDMRTCPDAFVDPNAANYETFAQSCVEGTGDVTLRLTDASGNVSEQVTDPSLNNTFSGLADGTYTLYSDIPREAASEYLFCVADGGNRYQKEFNENGVTTFFDLTGEQITCSWYVVPQDARGEETGGTLTVHASVCPVAYDNGNYFEDCHDEGIDDSTFTLTGPAGELTGTTNVAESGGPGLLAFTSLPEGNYTLAGGPPGDFGSVVIYCSDEATDQRINAGVDGTTASFYVDAGQDILCDWYYIPDDARGEPTEEPEARAEILITLFECAPSEDGYAGWGFSDLDDTCTETMDGVTFRLGAEGAPPLTADTGASGPGAVRFYELLPGTYTVTPSLSDGYSNVALYCSVGDSTDVYQKSLENGATTYNDLEGEQLACSWFVTSAPEETGPGGSITVREFICDGDKSAISDWEKECVAGATGDSYVLTAAADDATAEGTPNGEGVLVFEGLADGFYALEQSEGTWCRATAEHVDSSSRVIVRDGGNTDVYLFHCGEVTSLPSTGTGAAVQEPSSDGLSSSQLALLIAAVLLTPAAGIMLWTRLRRQGEAAPEPGAEAMKPVRTETGMLRMRFK